MIPFLDVSLVDAKAIDPQIPVFIESATSEAMARCVEVGCYFLHGWPFIHMVRDFPVASPHVYETASYSKFPENVAWMS